MKISMSRNFVLCLAVAGFLAAVAPAGQAQSATQLDKHARKIEKHLAKYSPGSYLQFDFRDSSEVYGSLGSLTETSFQFTNADSNRVETRSYDDVAHIKKAREYIGAGSESGHHVRLWVPLVIGGAAAAAAVAAVEVVH